MEIKEAQLTSEAHYGISSVPLFPFYFIGPLCFILLYRAFYTINITEHSVLSKGNINIVNYEARLDSLINAIIIGTVGIIFTALLRYIITL